MNDLERLKEKKALVDEKERRLCKKSLFYFAKEILGYKDLSENVHREWEEFIKNNPDVHKLLLVPRGHFKTSFLTEAYTLWRIIQNPNIRILVASGTYKLATEFLSVVKGHFEQNSRFCELFGDYVSSDKKWTESKIIVSKRTDILKEPTVQAMGVGGNLVGDHYDLIILDDVVNEKNVYTKEQIEKIINWWKASYSLLDPGSRMQIYGTRWHYGDLYGHIIEHLKDDLKGDFEVFKRGCFKDDGTPYFPEVFTPKEIERRKKVSGSAFFSAQYLNEPVSAEHAIFKIEWLDKAKERGQKLKLKQSHDHELQACNVVIGVDLAISVKESADYFALVVLGIYPNGDKRVLHIFRDHLSKKEQIDTIRRFSELFFPKIVYVENNAYQDALVQDLKSETSVPVRGFTTGKEKNSWELGIPSMAVQFENGKFIFPRADEESIRMTDILIQELLQYPKGHTGDLVMALWLANEAARGYEGEQLSDLKEEDYMFGESIF